MKAPLLHHEESRQSQISFCCKISSKSLHLYEVEHDLHSRMNNLSCWKRTRKNSGLTRNPILAIDRKQRLVGHITAFHSDSKVRTMWNVEYEIINFVSPTLVSCSLSYLSHSFTQVKIHILSFYFLTSHAWMHSLLMLQRTQYCVCQ